MSQKLTAKDHLRLVAQSAKDYADQVFGALVTSISEAMEEMESAKADKPTTVAISIPTTGWATNAEFTHHSQYYDILVTGITSIDVAMINIAPDSSNVATDCGLYNICETLSGKIRIRANSVPTEAISGEYWILDGREA